MEEQKLINALESVVENINLINSHTEKITNLLDELENDNEELRKYQWMIIQILKKHQQEIEKLKWKINLRK